MSCFEICERTNAQAVGARAIYLSDILLCGFRLPEDPGIDPLLAKIATSSWRRYKQLNYYSFCSREMHREPCFSNKKVIDLALCGFLLGLVSAFQFNVSNLH